jgi:DNA-directed RNA polymerase omega subunit
MSYVALEKLIDKNPSLYKLVLAAAERANQLTNGSKPLVVSDCKKTTTMALREMEQGVVRYSIDEE